MQTASVQLIREINLKLLFNLIRQNGEESRAGLVQTTGLGKATVSAIVDDLLSGGLVVEGGMVSGSVGRRPTMLGMNPNGPCLAALHVQTERIIGALIDLEGRALERIDMPNRAAEGRSTIRVISEVLAAIAEAATRRRRRILGAGVSLPGILNPPGDVVLSAPGLGWRDVSLRRILERTVRFPIWLSDDAKMAALAEAAMGAGRGTETLLYLGLGATVSAGLVRHGRLASGTHAGHLTVRYDGAECWCGNRGCLDTMVSEESICRRARELRQTRHRQSIAEDNLSAFLLGARADAGDPTALRVIQEAGRWLGLAIANLINLYQPELVLLGGWAVSANGALLGVVRDEVHQRALPALIRLMRIELAQLGEDAVLMGASVMALEGAIGSK